MNDKADPTPPPSAWFFFDESERALVSEALSVAARVRREQGNLLQLLLARLGRLAELIRDTPSIAASWSDVAGPLPREGVQLRGPFSGESLIELLCRVPDYDLDLHIPTKAVLGQSYLIAKINFFKALGYALEPAGQPDLLARLEHELGQSIYSKLAEELFISIVTDPAAAFQVKAGAARFLFRIWEERLRIEVDDFAPLLESVWEARSKVLPVLGTMMGTHEVFQVFREARDSRFLDYFGGDDVDEEQLLAFEEFLFGLSHEEIVKLREHLGVAQAACVSPEEARGVLAGKTPSWAPHADGPQAFYTSYKKRRVKAHYRALTGTPGPKRTAEEYVMIGLLQRGLE